MAKKYRPKKCFSKKYRFSQFPNFPKFPTKILSQKHTQKFEFQNEERLQNPDTLKKEKILKLWTTTKKKKIKLFFDYQK